MLVLAKNSFITLQCYHGQVGLLAKHLMLTDGEKVVMVLKITIWFFTIEVRLALK